MAAAGSTTAVPSVYVLDPDRTVAHFEVQHFGTRVAEVRGEFTAQGTSQPLSLRARHFACRQDGSVEVCGGDFEAEILRSEFGASSGLPLIGDRVRLVVQVEGRPTR